MSFKVLVRNRATAFLASCLCAFTLGGAGSYADASPGQLPLYHGARSLELENGFRALLVPNPKPALGVSLRLVVQVGNLHEAPAERGYAHFIEHLAFSAAPGFQDTSPQKQFALAGASLGPDINATTSPLDTIYRLELPDTRSGTLDLALRWFAEIAGALEFRPDNVDPERAVIEAELGARSTPNLRAMAAEVAFIAPAHRYRHSLAVGDKAVVAAATPARLQAFYHEWYRASRMHLIVVSDVPTARLEKLVRHHFGALLPGPAHRLAVESLGDTAPVGLHLDADLPVASARIRVLKPHPVGAIDSRDRRIRRLRIRLVLDGLTRRLRALRTSNRIPILDGVAAVGEFVPGYESAAIATTGPAAQWPAVLSSAERELRRFYRHGLTATELAEQKTRMVRYFEQLAAASHGIRGALIADQAARDLTDQRTFIDAHTELSLAQEAARDFDQTEARALIQELLPPKNWRVFLAGPPGAGLNLANVQKVLATSRASKATAPYARVPGRFAYAHPGPPVAPLRREALQPSGVLRLHYANGVVVNLVPTGFQRQEILITLRVGHGAASVPSGQEHLLALANRGFIAGGLEAHGIDELASIFAGRRVGGRFSSAFDAFELHGSTDSKDLLDQLRIFAAFLMAPGLRQPELHTAIRDLVTLRSSAARSLDGVLGTVVSRFLRGGDVRFGYPDRAIDLQGDGPALARWLRPQLRDGPIELNIVGDVLPREAIAALDASFGILPARAAFRPPSAERRHLVAPPIASVRDFSVQGTDDRGLVLLAWPVPDRRDHHQALALEVIASMVDQRIRQRLRDELGLVYSHYSAYQTIQGAADFGLLTTQAAGATSDLRRIERELRSAVAELRDTDVLRQAFAGVQQTEREKFRRLLERNQFWLTAISGSVRAPEKLDWIETVKRFDQLGWADLHRVIARHLQPDLVRTIRIRPADR